MSTASQYAHHSIVEEKYKGQLDTESDSDSESEDDEGELATKELDDEIMATLTAIRSKDPKVYDKDVRFYKTDNSVELQTNRKEKEKSKPVHLRDYHRQALLNGSAGDEVEDTIPTYAQEQSALKKNLLEQMHAVPDEGSEASDEDGFLVRKPRKGGVPSREVQQPVLDVETADRDPETYLSNFMASRAWAARDASGMQPFESDDDEDLEKADDFEAAYNMRFEDPNKLNETLTSHSRQAAEKYSVRRDDPKGRKKARQDERTRREEEKQQRESDKARLRRLRIEEAHEKWLKLKEAAGLRHQNLPDEKLVKFLEKGFEDDTWDGEMAKLLGEDYYNEDEAEEMNEPTIDATVSSKTKKKMKKPVWDDEIDIADIDPEFMTREERQSKGLTLSDEESDNEEGGISLETGNGPHAGLSSQKQKKKDAEKKRSDQKRQARLERRKIEELVDSKMDDSLPMPKHTGFRYRETSPSALGLTARDILMADDAQLNQYAGLKKLAAFREESKKARDRKKLGKKARLRQWRKDTFGGEEVRDEDFEQWFNKSRGIEGRGNITDKDGSPTGEDAAAKRKKKKSRKRKATEEAA